MNCAKTQKEAVHRIKIIQGQLAGLLRSLDKGCSEELLSRSLVIQRSLRSFDGLLFEECLKSQACKIRRGDKEALKEIKTIYNL